MLMDAYCVNKWAEWMCENMEKILCLTCTTQSRMERSIENWLYSIMMGLQHQPVSEEWSEIWTEKAHGHTLSASRQDSSPCWFCLSPAAQDLTKSVASPVSASFHPHSSRDSVLSFAHLNRLCKCHLPPFFVLLITVFISWILWIISALTIFLSFSFSLSFSLSLSLLASFMCFVLSLPAATYGLVWQLLSYLGLSGAFRMHKGWRARCQEC